MAMKQITIIAGHDTNEKREKRTRAWLEQHGVKVEEWNGLQVLTMQAEKPSEGQYRHQWVIGFDNAEGDQEQSWFIVSLSPDPIEAKV